MSDLRSAWKRTIFGYSLLAAGFLVICAHPLQAQTETLLYSFVDSQHGDYPFAALILDAKGDLYGTAADTYGGGHGEIFEISPNGTKKVLYRFAVMLDGGDPESGLVFDPAGNLYGTTPGDGANRDGVVFKLTPTGVETVLYNFTG